MESKELPKISKLISRRDTDGVTISEILIEVKGYSLEECFKYVRKIETETFIKNKNKK